MRIIISGINGFIGSRLEAAIREKGWEVVPLQRRDFALDADKLAAKLNGADALIHLVGAPIVHRWSEKYKIELRDSRINTTKKLVDAIKLADQKPGLFISTSAIGIYAANTTYSEKDFEPAGGFIGQLCQDWETEAKVADVQRTVIFRLGVVLAKEGGAFPKMVIPFKLGLGGIIGSGKQAFSWIHIHDLIKAYLFVIENATAKGVYNLCSPQPVNNKIFTVTLSKTLHLPAIFKVPVFAIKLLYGEGATAVTTGQSVIPLRLLEAGFKFDFPTLDSALKNIIM